MPTGKRERGFSYLFVLMLVGLIGLGLAAAGTLWKTEAQREREAELLFIGTQYRQAIKSYYELDPNQPRLPQSVDDLLEDNRRPEPVRHLRRAWRDPFGGEWQWIQSQDPRGIVGVHSSSTLAPLRTSGFTPPFEGFTDARSHADWRFVFDPPAAPRVAQ
ncbi:MAG: type II secretion system protein [Pseudomonadota bacterium]